MKSKITRWSEACAKASEGLNELQSLQEEYGDWLENMPENLSGSATAEKLQEVADFDLESAIDIVTEAESLDLPRGYGND